MSDQLQDLDLSGNSLDIALIDNLILFEYLDGDLLLGGQMDSQEDLAEGSLSEFLAYLISSLLSP